MPLEIPKSPVQHLRHRVSGFSIPGRLPCLLAVVLGLFAHQGALAQTQGSALSGLTVAVSEGTGTVDPLDPDFAPGTDTRTFTTEVPFGVTQVTVDADEQSGWEVAYQGAADADGNAAEYQRDLRLGTNTITVRATKTADPPETARNYTIRVTRLAETGSALSDLTLSAGEDTLDPDFAPATDDRTFTADVLRDVTTLTVTGTAKPGWEVTYHDDPDANSGTPGYQRNLAVGANRITVRATPTGASGTRNYTITVTRTTTPSEPRNLRAASADRSVRLTWTAPSSDGGRDIVGYDFRSKDADEDDGQWMDNDTWSPISGSNDSTTSHDVDSLTNGTTYIFQVRARNANGNGRASNTAEATPARPLPAPQDVVADTAGHEAVTAVVELATGASHCRGRAYLTRPIGTWKTRPSVATSTGGASGQAPMEAGRTLPTATWWWWCPTPPGGPTPLPASPMARNTASRYEEGTAWVAAPRPLIMFQPRRWQMRPARPRI